MFQRSSGILMHISSLPGKYGIGDFGKAAYEFVDFLAEADQKLWQILPIGPTGYGDSPYQSFSAFAGNPYFIDVEELVKEGYISKDSLTPLTEINYEGTIDFEALHIRRNTVLKEAYEGFIKKGEMTEFKEFRNKNSDWIENYALYMALKEKFSGNSWEEWPKEYKFRDSRALRKAAEELQKEMGYFIFIQYLFQRQWFKLKEYANSKGVKIIGDIPIFVATDSADTWAEPKMFQFNKHKKPKSVAGCPPDAFSKDGQLWGNILYDWDYMRKTGYEWWIKRIKACFEMHDIVRIDHFRGFESYWSIRAGAKTAAGGRWVKGPGMGLFKAIKRRLGDLPIIAEDLGFLTPSVKKLLAESGYPGMKILEFAFDSREESDYLPEKYTVNSTAYTGTHDNMTVVEWYETVRKEDRKFCDEYLNKYLKEFKGDTKAAINWKFIEAVWASNSVMSLAQMQDFLGLGAEARMNTPSTLGTNWKWRAKEGEFTKELAYKISELTKKYNR